MGRAGEPLPEQHVRTRPGAACGPAARQAGMHALYLPCTLRTLSPRHLAAAPHPWNYQFMTLPSPSVAISGILQQNEAERTTCAAAHRSWCEQSRTF